MLASLMPRAQELDEVSPGIFVWQAYDSKVKADLFSTALETDSGAYIVDPIPLAPAALLALQAHHPKTVRDFCHERQPRASGRGLFQDPLRSPLRSRRITRNP